MDNQIDGLFCLTLTARFHRSMAAAKIKPNISIHDMRRIILRTIAVSGLRDAQVRYYAGAGPGGFALSHDECVEPTFYVMVINGKLILICVWAI
jgi:4-amino-4-deoxychorismate lyase